MRNWKVGLGVVVLSALVVGMAGSTAGASSVAGPKALAGGMAETASKKKKKQQRQRRRARRMISNGQYVGTRGDGRSIDHTLCANGKYLFKTGTSTGTGISSGRGWRVTMARIKKRRMTAIVKARGKDGPEVAIRKVRQRWMIGYVAFGKPAQFGDVERTGAKSACASL